MEYRCVRVFYEEQEICKMAFELAQKLSMNMPETWKASGSEEEDWFSGFMK